MRTLSHGLCPILAASALLCCAPAARSGSGVAEASVRPVARPASSVRPVAFAPEELAALRKVGSTYSGSVVSVDAYREAEDQPIHRRGAGVLATRSGYLFTPSFVVDGADTIIISFGGDTRAPAHVIGRDAQTKLAVLKINFVPDDVACPALCAADGEKDGVPVALLAPASGDKGALIGSVSGSGKSIGPLKDVTEASFDGKPSPMGGVLLNARGELVGLALGSVVEGPESAPKSKVYLLPASQIRTAVERILKSEPEPQRRPAAPSSIA